MSRTLISLAGFQVIISGRFWVIAEVLTCGGIAFVFCPRPNMTCWEQVVKTAPTVLCLVARYPLRLQHTMALSVSLWLFFFLRVFCQTDLCCCKEEVGSSLSLSFVIASLLRSESLRSPCLVRGT